jgi:hypothetical protein
VVAGSAGHRHARPPPAMPLEVHGGLVRRVEWQHREVARLLAENALVDEETGEVDPEQMRVAMRAVYAGDRGRPDGLAGHGPQGGCWPVGPTGCASGQPARMHGAVPDAGGGAFPVTESHEGHSCWEAVSVRFAAPGKAPHAAGLAAAVINAVMNECRQKHAYPTGVVMVCVGPAGDVQEMYEQISTSTPLDARTVANHDQVLATMKSEPSRFAALAVAHVERGKPAS